MSGSVARLVRAATLCLSLTGIALIKNFEGTVYTGYLDTIGVPTICTGSTKNVFVGQKATLAECEARLVEDTTYAGKAVARMVQHKLTQDQYDALVSFTFNVGGGNLYRSTLLKKLNAGDCLGAANEFLKWNRAGGRVLPGLTKRRKAEADVFRKDCNAW